MPKTMKRKKEATQVLSVLGYEDLEERGALSRRITRTVRTVIDVEKLADEVEAFMGAMETIIGKLSAEVSNYHMETIAVTAEVSAKGQISLLGSGGEVAGKGGLTFTFKRAASAKTNP